MLFDRLKSAGAFKRKPLPVDDILNDAVNIMERYIGHEPDVDRAIDVGGATVALEIRRDDLMVVGQRGKDGAEHLAGREPAVEQDHRLALAEVLVDLGDVGEVAADGEGPEGVGREA